MNFWLGITIALLVAVRFITFEDPGTYTVRRSNEVFGLIIGALAITLIVVHLLAD